MAGKRTRSDVLPYYLGGQKFFAIQMWAHNLVRYRRLRFWSGEMKKKYPRVNLNALFNSILPALTDAVHNNCYEKDGRIYVRMDFGDIVIDCKASEMTPE
jgi:hypothetical protein